MLSETFCTDPKSFEKNDIQIDFQKTVLDPQICNKKKIHINTVEATQNTRPQFSEAALFDNLIRLFPSLSVSMSCDQVVNQISQCLCLNGTYIYNLPERI